MDKVIKIYKNKGETPLDCIKKYKLANPSLAYLPITYTGRLDPLAEGVLILLVGDECLKKDEYLKLPKEYEVDILFGFTTDTYDVMGKVKTTPEILFERSSDEGDGNRGQTISNRLGDEVSEILFQFTGKIKQKYPIYSSRPVKGKPLFMWAREGKLGEIEIPEHDVFIESLDFVVEDFITGEKLLEKVKNDISLVKGDFRQEEIVKLWEENLENKKEERYKTIKIRVQCGSGVYVRVLAYDIGQKLGIPALALNIKRTKVGKYINNSSTN